MQPAHGTFGKLSSHDVVRLYGDFERECEANGVIPSFDYFMLWIDAARERVTRALAVTHAAARHKNLVTTLTA